MICDDTHRNWELRREKSSDDRVRFNDALLTDADENVFRNGLKWVGEVTLQAYWPLNTDKDLDAGIRKLIESCKRIIGNQGNYKEGPRSINAATSLHLSCEQMIALIDVINELSDLITQADGENKLTAWMIPDDFFYYRE